MVGGREEVLYRPSPACDCAKDFWVNPWIIQRALTFAQDVNWGGLGFHPSVMIVLYLGCSLLCWERAELGLPSSLSVYSELFCVNAGMFDLRE